MARNRAIQLPAEDTSSPYFLHPSDNPGIILVPQHLTGANYISWSRSFITALLAKNKMVFVDGSILRPARDDLLYPQWIRCNSMVISWLRNSVSPQICSSIMYLDDAYAIWYDLKERFSTGDSARIYQLKQQLMSLSQGSSDINTYFTNLRIVWDEYKSSQPISWCTCGRCTCDSASRWNNHQENDCTVQFLIGLNSSFSQIRSHILSMIPLPSLSKVFSLVIQEERQRLIDGKSFSSLSTRIPATSELPFANAATSAGRGFNKFLCSHCGRTNHPVEKCFILHGFPLVLVKERESLFNLLDLLVLVETQVLINNVLLTLLKTQIVCQVLNNISSLSVSCRAITSTISLLLPFLTPSLQPCLLPMTTQLNHQLMLQTISLVQFSLLLA